MGYIRHNFDMTKYKIVPLTAVGKYKLLAMLISSYIMEFFYKFFSTSLDFILDYSRVVINSISSRTIPLDEASNFKILS